MSAVRLRKCPVPTWLTQRSSCPSRSARNATNFPSGEISARPFRAFPVVKRENCALASGFSGMIAGRRTSHTPTPATSDRERNPRQPRRARALPAAARRWPRPLSVQRLVDRVDLDPDVADVPQALLRILGETSEQAAVESARAWPPGSSRPVRLALENLRDRVRDRVAGETRRARSTSRTARSRTPRCRCACRPACRAPARGSCRRPCRGSTPVRGRVSGACVEIGTDGRRRRPSPGRSRAPSPTPSGVILMFAGFRSRWTMPFSCAASSASAICRAIVERLGERQARDVPSALRERALSVRASVSPSTSSRIRNRTPSASSKP